MSLNRNCSLQIPPLTPSAETLAASCQKFIRMKKELEFTLDTIEIIPNNSICHIQAPSIENADFFKLFERSKYSSALQIVLNLENKEKFKNNYFIIF